MKKRILLFLLVCITTGASYFYFTPPKSEILTREDFKKWRIEQKKNKKPTYGFPDKAMQWYYNQRAYPLGYIPEGWRQQALEHIERQNQLMKGTNVAALNWTSVGPGNIGGRIRSIVVHPSNPDIIYIGSVGGGVWKTSNGGNSWVPLKDHMENLAVCSMVMDPSDPNVIYAGTGEGFYNGDALRGEGIFKTTDAGATWSRLSSTVNNNFYYVNKLVFDNTTNTLWAGTRKGLFKSNDGGNSFSPVLTGGSGGDVHCLDVEIAASNPTTIFASLGHFSESTLWRSTDAGSNWETNHSVDNMGRIEIAVSQSNPSTLYIAMHNLNTSGVSYMAKTTNKGNSWEPVTVPGPSYAGQDNYAGGQAWYDNILFVDPDNASVLFAGGIDFWKSTSGGNNWNQKTNWYPEQGAPQYVHADQHAITFAPSNSNIMYLGNDGGIWKSTNKGENWISLNNGLFITQFYYGAVAPTGNNYYGGAQDNGTIAANGSDNWEEIFGGDGGATEVDFTNPNNIYVEYVNFTFYKSTNGGTSFFKAMNGIPTGANTYDGTTDRTQFITPFSMDPNNSNTLVGGTYRVWRTTNGASNWSSISGDLTGDGTGGQGATISSVIIAKGNSNVIYAGCSNGRVQVTTDAGSNWNLRNSGLPNAYVTRIATDPSNPAVAYVTFSGFLDGSKVFKTINYGQNWTNISGNLPNIPVNCILPHPSDGNTLYVGTDLGIFSTTNAGGSWVQDNSGLANVSTHDLDYRASDNKIFAATHGRSMFSATLAGGTAAVLNVNVNSLHFDVLPGSTRTKEIIISNPGGANLSFNITGSFGDINNEKNLNKTLPIEAYKINKAINPKSQKNNSLVGSNKVNSSFRKTLGEEELIMDDGDALPDAFFGPALNGYYFYWANRFQLDRDFALEKIRFYMKTESANTNPVEIIVQSANGATIFDTTINMSLSSTGKWYEFPFPQHILNDLNFSNGSSFYLIVIALSTSLTFPAAYDEDGLVTGNSYWAYYEVSSGYFSGWVTATGSAAFLIRAVGNSGGGENQSPVANAQVSPNPAGINEAINFNGSGSSDPDGQITQYSWSFGDGGTSNQMNAAHSYSQAGVYNYSLTVTDNLGATGQTNGQITVTGGDASPWTINPESGTIPPGGQQSIIITFDASGLPEGNYTGHISVSSNGGNSNIPVTIFVSNSVDVNENGNNILSYRLEQNFPNPFNPSTTIRWSLTEGNNVQLKIFNLNGEEVATLVDEYKDAGNYEIIFDAAKTNKQKPLASGVYFYTLNAGNYIESRKFVLMK